MVAEYGLQNNVSLVDKYLEFDELINYLGATDIYLTPYSIRCRSSAVRWPTPSVSVRRSFRRRTSTPRTAWRTGAASWPLSAIADALAERILELLDDPWLRRATERRAYHFGRHMTWPHVAQEYGALFDSIAPAKRRAVPACSCRHNLYVASPFARPSRRAERRHGVVQHAVLDVPNRVHRLLHRRRRARRSSWPFAPRRTTACASGAAPRAHLPLVLARRAAAGRALPQLHGLRSHLARRGRLGRLDRPRDLGAGRTACAAPRRQSWRTLCAEMVKSCGPAARGFDLSFVPARYAALGLTQVYDAGGRSDPALKATLLELGRTLVAAHAASTGPGWDWFENEMTYDNARLPEACLRLGMVLEDRSLVDLGLQTLEFYESVTMEERVFVPIGNMGWHVRGGKRARYGQQPLEAAAMVDAALVAHAVTGELRYRAWPSRPSNGSTAAIPATRSWPAAAAVSTVSKSSA